MTSKAHKLFTSLYQTDKMYRQFGATDDEIKDFNSLLLEINKGNYVAKKEFEAGIIKIMEFINKLDDENDFMFMTEYPEDSGDEGDIDQMSPQAVLHAILMVNFSAVLWMRKYNVNITDPDDFGAIAFSNILSADAFDNNVNSIIYLNELCILPMFLNITRLLLHRAVIRGEDFRIHENAQNTLYSILHLLQQEDSKSISKTIEKFSIYCSTISNKQNENNDQFHGGDVFYYFEPKLARIIMDNLIAINGDYEMEKEAYDVLTDSIIELVNGGKKIEDFKQVGLMILQKSKVELTEEKLIVLHRKKGYDE